MPYPVKVFSGHPEEGGVLKAILPGEGLTYIDDPAPEETKKRSRYKGLQRPKPETIDCEVCGRTVSFENHRQRTCRKVACMAKMKEIKAARDVAIKGGVLSI